MLAWTLKTLYFCKVIKKNLKDFFKEFYKKLWKKSDADEKIVPSTQRPSVLYWRLSYFRWNPPLNVFKQIFDSNAPKPSNVCCNFHAVYSAPLDIWIINAFYASPICTIHKYVKAPSLHYIVNSFIYVMACMLDTVQDFWTWNHVHCQ